MKTIGTVCLKVVDVIGKICEYICAALAMIITLLVFIQVILRALNMPLFGIEELLTFPTIWAVPVPPLLTATSNAVWWALLRRTPRQLPGQRAWRISVLPAFPSMC